jgi:hypothetical protein
MFELGQAGFDLILRRVPTIELLPVPTNVFGCPFGSAETRQAAPTGLSLTAPAPRGFYGQQAGGGPDRPIEDQEDTMTGEMHFYAAGSLTRDSEPLRVRHISDTISERPDWASPPAILPAPRFVHSIPPQVKPTLPRPRRAHGPPWRTGRSRVTRRPIRLIRASQVDH